MRAWIDTAVSRLHLLKRRFVEARYPRIVAVTVRSEPGVFEVNNPVEEYRAEKLGGERDAVHRFLDEVEADDVVWDVGGNIGVYTIFAARNGASVVAFEPDPGFRDRLRRNVALNGMSGRVTIDQRALSDTDESAELHTHGTGGPSPTLHASGGNGDRDERLDVELIRGDGIDHPTPDVLKIDVEGAEVDVMTGLGAQLDEIRCVLVEIHPEMIEAFGSRPAQVKKLLRDAGLEEAWEITRNEQEIVLFKRP